MAPGEIKPWRCDSCDRLMYAIAYVGGVAVPSSGAPFPLWLNNKFPEVCSLCFDMYKIIDKIEGTYWRGKTDAKPLTPDRTLDESLKDTLSQW